ncbi:hypothetical protein [Ancylobacter defluvii]|uniref:Uncharacterized protein n=1 Tax=Ancylobacter defluvii TaxID=1282440 RepID=A0A9W6JZB3_9HYPH|nr:hypothetical protein [Ancylobacter defluvii]MBS7589702.1 hypothetical protein [Ancylobacter defluvii]GLK85326.1 hypothetical protein GCM10017653_33960 [Ancylobacter defluvii]
MMKRAKACAVWTVPLLLIGSSAFAQTAVPSWSVPGTGGNVVLNPVTPPAGNPGNATTISPGWVGPAPNPGASNPSQASPPQSPGVFVTIPIP